jgi:hypothetical protein
MLGKCTRRLASRLGLATCTLYAPCRLTSTHARIATGDALGPTRDGAHQTFRLRNDETARELPVPPLLDPVILEKRLQWENTKARPKAAERTPFQKKLQATPYGNSAALHISRMPAEICSPCTGIASAPMPRNSYLAPRCIPHISAHSSTS